MVNKKVGEEDAEVYLLGFIHFFFAVFQELRRQSQKLHLFQEKTLKQQFWW